MGPINVGEVLDKLILEDNFEEYKRVTQNIIEVLPEYYFLMLSAINADLSYDEDNIKLLSIDRKWVSKKNKALFYTYVAESYENMGKGKEALELFCKAYPCLKRNSEFLGTFADFLFHCNNNLAEKFFKKAIKFDHEKTSTLYLHYGVLLEHEDRNEEAANMNRICLKINPNLRCAHYNLGVALGKMGKMDEARDEYLKEISLKDGTQAAYYNLGLYYKNINDYEKAKYYYLKGIEEIGSKYKENLELKQFYGNSWYNMMCVYALEKNYKDAVDCLRLAQDIFKFKDDSALKKDEELNDFLLSEEYRVASIDLYKDK